MSWVMGDDVLETTITGGTGTITLAGAVSGFRAFSAVAANNGDTFYYKIRGGTEWENGFGTRLSSTTFSRDTVISSSNSGALVNFTAGTTKEVWMPVPAKFIQQISLPQTASEDLLINGFMDIDQEHVGGNVTLGTLSVYVLDMWKGARGSSQTILGNQFTPTVLLFGGAIRKSFKMIATAGGAVSGGDLANMGTGVEGYRASGLGFGQSGGIPITVSGFMYPTIGGTAVLTVNNGAFDRSYLKTFVVTAAQWNYFSITVPADTTGTWDTTSGIGLWIGISLGAGSSIFGTDAAWNAGFKAGVSGNTNFFASTNNEVHLAGVRCVKGDRILPQEHQLYFHPHPDRTLTEALRYYEKSFALTTAPAQNAGVGTGEWLFPVLQAGATGQRTYVPFQVRKRNSSSTITTYNPAAANLQVRDESAAGDCSATATGDVSARGFSITCTGNAGGAIAGKLGAHFVSDNRL